MKELNEKELKCINGGDAADKFLAGCTIAGGVMFGIGLIATGPVGIAVGIMGGCMGWSASLAGVIKALAQND